MGTAFKAASEAAEQWLTIVATVADFGRNGCNETQVDKAFRLLAGLSHGQDLQSSFDKYSEALQESFDRLAALSDSPIDWSGRGRQAIVVDPSRLLPQTWSSAHEAACGIARMTLELLVWPLADIEDEKEQRDAAKLLLSGRWKACVIGNDELSALQERIRRERAKLLADTEEWSEAKSPAEWRKQLDISETTLRRHRKEGKLVVQAITTKLWKIRLDSLQNYLG